jgi:hypothetical protein
MLQTLRALRGMLQSLYRLMPGAVVVLIILLGVFGFFLSRSELVSQATAVVIIFLVSIAIYAKERNYAQAVLAFVVGLLPALSMTWSPGRFWLFVGGFVVLNGLFFVLNAIRIAGENEHIYNQAAVFAEGSDHTMTAEKLEKLAVNANVSSLGAITRAECVRQLMFRNFPIELLPAALKSIETLSTVTGLLARDVAGYMVILYPLADVTGVGFSRLDDLFYLTLRNSAATPEEFFEAFRVTRNLVLSGQMNLEAYLDRLSELLGLGLGPDEIRKTMEAS